MIDLIVDQWRSDSKSFREPLFHIPFHDQAGFKYHYFLGRHRNFLSCAWIAAEATAPGFDLKNAEVPQLHRLARGEILRDLIERILYNALHIDLLNTCLTGNFEYNILLCNGHDTPPLNLLENLRRIFKTYEVSSPAVNYV